MRNLFKWTRKSHLIFLLGCSKENFFYTLHGIYLLLNYGLNCHLADRQGNTPLTYLHHLLDRGLTSEATVLCHVLQLSRCDINHVNKANRTLLSYSVAKGDSAASLTRLLLNFGAKVFNLGREDQVNLDLVESLHREREQSAFTWFLRSLMEMRMGLDNCEETIYLMGTAMGEDPNQMRSHVTRTMLHLAHSARAMGPLFQNLKQKLLPFWTKPQPLKYLCLKQIRQSLGPKKLSELRTLDLPFTMLQYLQLYWTADII